MLLQTPLRSAVILLPMNIIALVFSGLYLVAVSHFRKYVWSIWIGWVFLAVGVGLLHLIDQNASVAFRIGMPAVLAVGYGGLFTVLIVPMQASVRNVEDTGLAVGLLLDSECRKI